MNLAQTLRKAAGLLVELPPEETPAENTVAPQGSPRPSNSATDKMWAELEKAAQPNQANAANPQGNSPMTTKTVEQIVREEAGPNLDQIQVNSTALPDASGSDGTVNFNAIYEAAKLPSVPFTAEQALEMLAALPTDVALDNRRKMMNVSINAMGKAIGATPQNIVADASRKLAALNAYTQHLAELTTEYTTASERKIAALQAEIEQIHQTVMGAQQRQARESQVCVTESRRLDELLEFFSLDVAPSEYANPTGDKSDNPR